MIHQVYSVYDSKSEIYSSPFFYRQQGEASRAWSDAVNDSKTAYYSHPEDYTLFYIGQFDDQDGTLNPLEAKIPIGVASQFKKL